MNLTVTPPWPRLVWPSPWPSPIPPSPAVPGWHHAVAFLIAQAPLTHSVALESDSGSESTESGDTDSGIDGFSLQSEAMRRGWSDGLPPIAPSTRELLPCSNSGLLSSCTHQHLSKWFAVHKACNVHFNAKHSKENRAVRFHLCFQHLGLRLNNNRKLKTKQF